MFKSLIIISLLVCNSLAFWTPCTGGRPAPRLVTSPQCGAERCDLTRGDVLSGSAWFTPVGSHGRVDVFVVANGVFDIPITPPGDNACNSLFRGGAQVACPTLPNVEHEWQINIPVPTDIPAFPGATFMFELVDVSTLEVISCWNALADLH